MVAPIGRLRDPPPDLDWATAAAAARGTGYASIPQKMPLLGRLRDPPVHCAHTRDCECSLLESELDHIGSPR